MLGIVHYLFLVFNLCQHNIITKIRTRIKLNFSIEYSFKWVKCTIATFSKQREKIVIALKNDSVFLPYTIKRSFHSSKSKERIKNSKKNGPHVSFGFKILNEIKFKIKNETQVQIKVKVK